MAIPQEQIDADAQKVVRRLTRSGFDAYLVGGCVRDLLLGRKPKDFDVATSATPPEIRALFRNCRIIGRRFRLAHIFFGSKIIETSTFRANPREVDGEALDDASAAAAPPADPAADELFIRRDNVFGTAEEDARRRDFTINGLFYDLDADRVIDYVEGLPDLERRMVRTIGDADIRFREDPIRILRAIKFAARLDFEIEPSAYQAILEHRREIAKCAPPRVLEEIYRLLKGGAARRSLELLQATGVLEILMPDLARLCGREGDFEGTRRLVNVLERLDARIRDGLVPSNSLLLGVLVGPFLFDVLYESDGTPAEEQVRDAHAIIEELGRPILESIRASRRDVERLRQILLAQRRLTPSKRRRGRPMALARREWFGDALLLCELLHEEPSAELVEELARWRRLSREDKGGGEPAGGEAEGEPRRRRRRRRGGRRRRRGGSDGGDLMSAGAADE
jgi:poly(A) polymerase